MNILETFASQNRFLRALAAKMQWHFGKCPSCNSVEAEGHTKHCELTRLLESRVYRSLGHLRGRPTTLPGDWGRLARAVGGVGALADDLLVSPRTLRQWAYQERRPSWVHIVVLREMMRNYGLGEPAFKGVEGGGQ